MDTIIAFTPGQLIGICGGFATISGAIAIIVNLFMKATTPNRLQNARLDAIELRLKEHDEYFKKDLSRFETIEDGNRVTQRAILALLSHSIDGNDIDNLRKAKDELQEYLIGR